MSSAENKLKAATRISNQFPLLRRLSIVSLLAMLVTASVMIVLYREDQLEEHRTIAAEQNERTLVYLTHTLGDRLAEFVAAPAERRAGAVRTFDASFTAALDAFHQSDVLKLKLYTPSGIIIYSSAKSEIGGASTHPDYLARALGGETVHRIEFRDSFLGAAGRMSGVDVALTYMPLVYDGRRIGVIELYDDVTPVFKRLDDNVIRIALIVFGAFSALYVALFLAVSRTDRAVLQWQKKIAQRDDELRESQCIAGLGSYILDVASGRWESSEVLDRVLGIDAGYPRTVAGWQALLHPDEREEMIHYLENQVLAQGASFDREFRIVRRSDMAERWVHGLGRPEFDGPGRAVRMHGTLQDITERKHAQMALAESRNLLKVIIDTAPVRIFWKDKSLRYLGCNPAFASDAGQALPEDVIGKDDYQLCWREQAELYRADDRAVIDSGVPRISYDEPQTTPDGTTVWLRTSKAPLRDASGEIVGVIGVYKDITEQKRVETALRESEARFRSVFEATPVPLALSDEHGNITCLNRAFMQSVGYRPDDIPTLNDWWRRAYPDEQSRLSVVQDWQSRLDAAAANRGQFAPVELSVRCEDEATRTFIAGAASLQDGLSGSHLIALYDITDRKRAECELRVAAVAFETHEAILITDANSNIVRVNQAFTDITGYRADEVLGKNPRIMNSGRHNRSFYIEMWQHLLCTGAWAGEIWDRRSNGDIYPKWMTITAVKNDRQETTHYVAIFSDITERKLIEEEIHHLAFYDTLTKLPNRRLFLDRFGAALSASARRNDYGAVLFVDMDRFKALNDTLGHDYGDLLLVEVGARIKSCIREMDTVARYGGDEFVVLIDAIDHGRDESRRKVAVIAEKIREALAAPYLLKEHEHRCSPSIGVSLFHGNDESINRLIAQADMAMYQAKKSGRNAVRFFDSAMQYNVATHVELDSDLHQAIALGQLHLHYQIQVGKDNKPLGAEAFLRWMHPERGLVMPDQFIPAAENGGFILEIDRWVLNTACRQLAQWSLHDNTRMLTLTVNISARLFALHDFVGEIENILISHRVDPSRLKLELSERLVLSDMNSAITKIHALRDMGVRLSMDNFATVYSSISFLKQLSSDQLKIHQEFVQGIMLDGNDARIVKTIIDLAKSLDMDVFAQGVETNEQREFLDDCECNAYQGYLFGKPLPIDQFDALLGQLPAPAELR